MLCCARHASLESPDLVVRLLLAVTCPEPNLCRLSLAQPQAGSEHTYALEVHGGPQL